jgi:hypothetical protein
LDEDLTMIFSHCRPIFPYADSFLLCKILFNVPQYNLFILLIIYCGVVVLLGKLLPMPTS